MRALLVIAGLLCSIHVPLTAASELEAAIGLFNARRYPEARDALEKIVAAEPKNAAACHYLGRILRLRSNDNASYEEALKWLAKAAELEPNNAIYLGIFGGSSLEYAGRVTSVTAATRGRDAMEKAVALDPGYLDARQGLYEFYSRAPWPFGSSSKAAAHLEEIRKRNPDLATVLGVGTKVRNKDFAAAFRLCEEALAKSPDNYNALYQFGRTASISGENLERGADYLRRCLTLEPPSPASPTHSHAWFRLGNVYERLKQLPQARQAYEAALQLDATNRLAADALAKLPPEPTATAAR